ncbi:39S ribosomal protein L41 [Tropilaelaps mercedesae]|uniref:39S ribosomal protein L41 n=1 Tax=Tropilaelaps mercedesae TaxID=418985 RepID=A0A1V9Y267_9ACAR|nr:39S ribosomal protein L41 [Tropilaelaps mercedesae]
MNSYTIIRGICTSSVRLGKKNFRKFWIPNSVRGTIHDRENPNLEDESFGQRMPYLYGTKEIELEMIPEIIVPNLKDFKLKPYVSYNVPDVVQSEFTAEDLFEAIYSEKIENDFREGKLDADGNPVEPSPEEKMTKEEAWANAKKTGADLFG